MSNLGLFNWIRDGVKQSVLMGVSDALENIGTPGDANSLHPALQSFTQSNTTRIDVQRTADASPRLGGETTPGRKRLGRSLKDINPPKAAS